MDTPRALELIDAHLDGEHIKEADAIAFSQWIKSDKRNADEAFRRVFLHTHIHHQMQLLEQLPAAESSRQHALLEMDFGDTLVENKRSRAKWLGWGTLLAAFLVASVYAYQVFRNPIASRTSHPFVYEPFDYPPHEMPLDSFNWPTDGGLSGANGGIGFASAWQELGRKVALVEKDPAGHPWEQADMRQFGALGYSDRNGNILLSQGNQLRTSAGPVSETRRQIDTTAIPASLVIGEQVGKAGGELWISFLSQSFDSSGDGRFAYLQLGTDEAGVRFGKLASVPSGNWSATAILHGNEVNLKSSHKPSGESVLWVIRIEFQPGAEQATIWINPDLNRRAMDQVRPDLQLTIPDFTIESLVIRSRYSTDFDEIRLGTSYADVTPIAQTNN
ncbi:hypothetical protein AB1K70_24945 [Bremerella sp. JC770]|uniref:hypothetical protein n=1 Tax=Bremerella sp. JC770 TaxID=3232137 RepID=UPI00345A3654